MKTQQTYEATCIEHGEVFVCHFRTIEFARSVIMEIGSQLASGWGAECIEVRRILPEGKLEDIYDADDSKYIHINNLDEACVNLKA